LVGRSDTSANVGQPKRGKANRRGAGISHFEVRGNNHAFPKAFMPSTDALVDFLPIELRNLPYPQTSLPRIAKDRRLTELIESALREIPAEHDLRQGGARAMELKPESVHLVLTSPPYWTLKEYRDTECGH
jgi:hypothetical protein